MSTLLWNNVCLLSRLEESFIETKTLNATVEYFGLGRKKDLQTFFQTKTPDWSVVVSTDTEIFQNPHLLPTYSKDLREFALDYHFDGQGINDDTKVKPFILIPLVIVINTTMTALRPTSIHELCDDEYEGLVTYGGPQNSAGKSLIKAIWSLYGHDALTRFIKNSHAASMPAAAFKLAMDGTHPIAIVPTIFAARQGLHNLISQIPSEGAIAIPSFIAVHNTCDIDNYTSIHDQILANQSFHQILYDRGCIISPLVKESQIPFYYPPKSFLDAVDYRIYNDILKSQNL